MDHASCPSRLDPATHKRAKRPAGRLGAVLALALLASGLLAAVPQAQASTISTGGGSSSQTCRDFPVATAPAVVASGDIVYCIMTDGPVPTSTSTFQASAILTTPALSSSTNSVAFTVVVSDSSCTFGSATTKGTPSMNGAYGTQSSSTWDVTMTSGNCHGYIEGKVTSNGVVLFDDAFAFDVESLDIPVYVDNLNRACASSAFGASCTTPSVNNALTGSLDTQARICAASALGASCTAPRTNEDTQHCATPIPATDLTKFTVAGTIRYCIRYPNQVPAGTHFLVQQELTYPQLVSGTDSLSAITDTFSGGTGCTITGSVFDSNRITSGGLTTSRQTADVVMTGTLCSTSWGAAVPSTSSAYSSSISATVTTPTLDAQDRLCAASALGASCTTPSQNVAITSWPTLALSGSISTATTLSGSVNIASWPALSGTVNTVTSGSLAVHQDALSGTVSVSPLSGTLTVHQDPLSGTLAVTNSGSQSVAVSGAVTVHQDPLSGTVSVSPLSGTLTVHQDPTTGTLGITSFPALTVHQDPICTAAQHCHVDGNTNTTLNVGQVNSNSTMSSSFSIDMPLLDQWVPLLFWIGMVFLAYWRVNISGARYLLMFTFCILALFTAMVPAAALLSLYGGIICIVFCLTMITMLNRFGFFPQQQTLV